MPAKRGPITDADYTVEDRGYETPCHIWNGPFTPQGYARYGRNPKPVHVTTYEAENGPVPPGSVVHHKCEEKRCIRGSHLEQVTRADHARIHRKISLELAEEIRRAPGTSRQVAHRYGISKTHAAYLRRSSD